MNYDAAPMAVAIPARFLPAAKEYAYGGTRFWVAPGASGHSWAVEVDDPCGFGFAATREEAVAKAKRFIGRERVAPTQPPG